MHTVSPHPEADRQTPRLRCVIYAAKSTQDIRGSIDTQLVDCRAAAQAEGRDVVDQYQDESASAFHGDRGPGLRSAFEHAERLAAAYGTAELWCQHPDRIARGDGMQAAHLIEYVLRARKTGVQLRAVQHDDTFRDLIHAVLTGERNHEDSARKAAAVAAGLRRTAERGEWQGGILADGYRVIRDVDERGHVTRRVEFDPDRAEIWRFIWSSAVAGWSVESIVLELDRRRVMTNPRRAGLRPRRFDANRVRQALSNPFYAGLSVHNGEVVGKGNWPAYVTPQDFEQAAADRLKRGDRTPGPGRPKREGLDYLLSGIARCGVCGHPMAGVTGRGSKNQRADGTRPRRYVCAAHGREYPCGHSLYCEAKPIDAELVDRSFAANLDHFLGDVGGWREQLAATRTDDLARLEIETQRALADIAEHERVAGRLRAKYDALVAAGDDAKAEIVLETLAGRRGQAQAARSRLNAAHDAKDVVAGEVPVDPMLDFFNRLSAELVGRVDTTRGDVRRTNAVLRDFFARIELTATDAGVRMLPVLSAAAQARILDDPTLWPHGVTANVHGLPPQTDGCEMEVEAYKDGVLSMKLVHVVTEDCELADLLPEVGAEVAVSLQVGSPEAIIADSESGVAPLRAMYADNPQAPS